MEPPRRGCSSAGHPSQRERDRKRENERVRESVEGVRKMEEGEKRRGRLRVDQGRESKIEKEEERRRREGE